MAIDYIVNRGCPAKDDLGAQGIIDLVKSRNRAQALYERFIADGMEAEEAMDAQFGIQAYTASGTTETKMVTVRQLLRQAELLEDHSPNCKECPISKGEAYGCYNAINYPISSQAEHWLAQCAGRAVKTGLPESILIKFILDEGVKGDIFGAMRTGHAFTYLESPGPLDIMVEKKLFSKTSINTNQVLDMFFAVGEMQTVHQQFLLFFSGGLTIQNHQPDLEKIGVEYQAAAMPRNDGGTHYWVYRMMDELRDDRSIKQIKAYLRALFAAHCTGVTVTIEY